MKHLFLTLIAFFSSPSRVCTKPENNHMEFVWSFFPGSSRLSSRRWFFRRIHCRERYLLPHHPAFRGRRAEKEELGQELKAIATDDEVTSQSSVQSFELPQFHGVQLKGNCEEEKCVYSYLLAKDGSCGFYVSIVYRQENDKTPETILKSFHMEE